MVCFYHFDQIGRVYIGVVIAQGYGRGFVVIVWALRFSNCVGEFGLIGRCFSFTLIDVSLKRCGRKPVNEMNA